MGVNTTDMKEQRGPTRTSTALPMVQVAIVAVSELQAYPPSLASSEIHLH